MLRTVVNKYTGQELRAQFDDFISEDEILIDALRVEVMENPYFDFSTRTFYDKKE
jgi:hypothetical protein